MKKIRLDISYLGTAYCGWQVQPNAVSVQQRLQDAVEKVFGERYALTGCSRTDSGVHAHSFICVLTIDQNANNIPACRVAQALNSVLPDDIAVRSSKEVPSDFHPRYSAKGKEYEYLICDGGFPDPLMHGRSMFCPRVLNVQAMQRAGQSFVGRQDFRAFMSSGSKIEDTVREIFYLRVTREENCIHINVAADGFLYNMVRIIVGTLVDVGLGKRSPDEIKDIIASGDRSCAGNTVPACGLYLKKVFYDGGE